MEACVGNTINDGSRLPRQSIVVMDNYEILPLTVRVLLKSANRDGSREALHESKLFSDITFKLCTLICEHLRLHEAKAGELAAVSVLQVIGSEHRIVRP
ncbi:hypothetical protein DBV15_00565 [Temnothorax longispinosus]|uniref:Uncharacterized protein n=1 Tax=Temnothorax longispinosus TaxID=300112 RepID=A0A4S2KSP7_9HYME|nr:hypothetical protein DBV15_00565 [Temnothorax longispinosus]